MTLVQYEYIVAVDDYRHFATAAQKCFVTQPTLSMQIQKLEEQLDVQIFDRAKHPVEPTEIGKKIIEEMEEKRKRLKLPRHFSIRPVLIHVNGVEEGLLDEGYFDKVIDFGQLLG